MSKKYLSDYRIDEKPDPATGRVQREVVYQGEYYTFLLQDAALRKAKILFGALVLLCVAALILALTANAPCARRWYVSMPLVVMVFPLFFLAESCVIFYTAKEQVTREKKEKITGRATRCAALCAFFSLFSVAGHIVSMVLYKETAEDIRYLAGAAVILACSAVMLVRRKDRQMQPLPGKG